MSLTDHELAIRSIQYRRDMLRWIVHAGAGHTGGGLSCMDILNVLYNRILRVSPETFTSPDRDRYIQSKGHCVEALYVVLADRGFFSSEKLQTMCGYDSAFVGHPTRAVPGIEHNTGALGHGLSVGVGAAIAGKKDQRDFRVYVLMGDGELAEGSNWEAAMSASHYKLDNLIAIVDHNTLQITGRTRDVCSNEPLDEKFKAFGWDVHTVNGHDFGQLTAALIPSTHTGKPRVVIANTIKGQGVSFMQDVAKWHHGVPSEAEYAIALRDLADAEAQLGQSKGAVQ
ncbi:MAG: transketolase [Burkholderiales bacterium]|nr:transketolase [Phycisphaerae bacterium]